MKAFYRKTIASCLSLVVLFLTIGSAAAVETEIRGPVYNGSDISNILSSTAYDDTNTITMDASNFATIYYDIDPNMINETSTLKYKTDPNINETLTLKYKTDPNINETLTLKYKTDPNINETLTLK